MLIDPTDIENTASDITEAVEDMVYNVEALKDALRVIRDAAEEGIDQLNSI